MKKVLIVLILFLIPSCSFFEIAIGFGGIMKPFIKIQKQVNKIEKICNKECKTYIKSSDEWCDCMYKCIRNVINKNSLESEDVYLLISVEGCSIDDFKNKLTK